MKRGRELKSSRLSGVCRECVVIQKRGRERDDLPCGILSFTLRLENDCEWKILPSPDRDDDWRRERNGSLDDYGMTNDNIL